eukprot:6212090-Pyramimonas_sp.AAC.1
MIRGRHQRVGRCARVMVQCAVRCVGRYSASARGMKTFRPARQLTTGTTTVKSRFPRGNECFVCASHGLATLDESAAGGRVEAHRASAGGR